MSVMVSILTTAYNHAPYIAQALESFVTQKTDFAFEVIVHDDASTDGTADIIRAYAEKYPDIIRPVLQSENKYSQGILVYDYMTPLIRGKYTAMCEGDDYWCDENKLQKQVDYMEAHPECSMCFCNSYDVDVNGNVIGTKEPVQTSRVFSSRELLATDGRFCATAGVLAVTSVLNGITKEWKAGEVGDLPMRCFLALQGNAYGFQEKMVCYRWMVPGSWTARIDKGKDRAKRIKWIEDTIAFYRRLLQVSNGRYDDVILGKLHMWEFRLHMAKANWKALTAPEFRDEFARKSARTKMIIFVKYHFPGIVKAVRFLKYGKAGLNKQY